MERTVPFLNGCISFVAFIVAFTLVVYMLIAFIAGMFDICLSLFDTVFLDPVKRQSIFSVINASFIHNIAFLVILMKVHSVLTEYMRQHTVDVKQVVEIAIVASVLELLFNTAAYSENMQIVLASLAAAMFAIYALRYHVETLKKLVVPEVITAPLKAVRARAAVEEVPVKATVRRVVKKAVK